MDSVVQKDDKVCFICGKPQSKYVTHHLFSGTANRQKAEEDKMVVYVHPTCHDWLHTHALSKLTIAARGQKVWEEIYGSREEFIERYGVSYIDKLEIKFRRTV